MGLSRTGPTSVMRVGLSTDDTAPGRWDSIIGLRATPTPTRSRVPTNLEQSPSWTYARTTAYTLSVCYVRALNYAVLVKVE